MTIAEQFDRHEMLDADKAKKLGGVGGGAGRWIFPDGSELHLIDCEWVAVAPHDAC